MPWQKACLLSELGNHLPYKAVLNGQPVLLALVDGEPKAWSDTCMHRGGSLSQGSIDGGAVTCPLHFWQFSLRDGRCLQVPSAQLKSYPLKIEREEIHVEV